MRLSIAILSNEWLLFASKASGAFSRVCGIFLWLREAEIYREPLTAAHPLQYSISHLCSCHILGSRRVLHPVLPSLEDFSNAGRKTKPGGNPSRCSAQKFIFRTVKAQALIAGGPFSNVMVIF